MPDEREVDPDRQRRQRLARRALEQLSQEPAPGRALGPTPVDVWGRLGTFLDGFLTAVFEGLADPTADAALAANIGDLCSLRADVASTPRLRPWVETWQAVDEVLSRLNRVAVGFLTAVGAEAPLEAQRAARGAQAELDAAAEPASSLADRLDQLARLASATTPEEALVLQAEVAFDASDASTLLELDWRGAEIFERITGEHQPPAGLGLALSLLTAGSSGQFDDARLQEVASRAYAVLTRDIARLSAILASPSWTSDFNDAAIRHVDASIAQDAALRTARNQRQEIRPLIDIGHSLVETSGKRIVATLLCTRPGKRADYEAVRDQDAGALLQRAGQDPELRGLIEGIDRAVRIARAHETFTVEDDQVVLRAEGGHDERLSTHELLDRILAGVESLSGLVMAVICAATKAGVPLEQFDSLSKLGFDPLASIEVLLAWSGWTDVTLEREDGTLLVSGSATLSPRTLHQVAALASCLPDNVEALELRAKGRGWKRLRGPIEPLRRAQAADDELTKQTFYVEGYRRWEADGRPLVDVNYFRKWTAILAAQAVEAAKSGDLRTGTRTIRALRSLAGRLGDDELERVLTAAIDGMRSRAMELPPSEATAELMPVLGSYLQLRGSSLLG